MLNYTPRLQTSILLIDEFCSKLQGYRCVYKFQKHIDEWSEKYSCQIRIYESLYY